MRSGTFTFSGKWLETVKSFPETGMGYTVVKIKLADGRAFNQALIDSGVLARVRGIADIPFTEEEIAEMSVTHEKWDWKEKP
jgi:hypothetical protein